MDYWSLLTGSMVCMEDFTVLIAFLDQCNLFMTAQLIASFGIVQFLIHASALKFCLKECTQCI